LHHEKSPDAPGFSMIYTVLLLRQLNMSMYVMPDPVSGTGQARSGIQSFQWIPASAGMTNLFI
jgi:hypothetical protein